VGVGTAVGSAVVGVAGTGLGVADGAGEGVGAVWARLARRRRAGGDAQYRNKKMSAEHQGQL